MLFPEYLFHLHCAMRASVPLITSGRDVARRMASDDPVAAAVESYFDQHIEEESEHADWLLDDMVALGLDREEILTRIPPSSVTKLVGTQYYWIQHVHPAMLLAYLAILEGEPMKASTIESHAKTAGIPPDGLRTLIYHAEADIEHRADLYRVVDALPLTPNLEKKLGLNALQAIDHLTQVFRGIVASAS